MRRWVNGHTLAYVRANVTGTYGVFFQIRFLIHEYFVISCSQHTEQNLYLKPRKANLIYMYGVVCTNSNFKHPIWQRSCWRQFQAIEYPKECAYHRAKIIIRPYEASKPYAWVTVGKVQLKRYPVKKHMEHPCQITE